MINPRNTKGRVGRLWWVKSCTNQDKETEQPSRAILLKFTGRTAQQLKKKLIRFKRLSDAVSLDFP